MQHDYKIRLLIKETKNVRKSRMQLVSRMLATPGLYHMHCSVFFIGNFIPTFHLYFLDEKVVKKNGEDQKSYQSQSK